MEKTNESLIDYLLRIGGPQNTQETWGELAIRFGIGTPGTTLRRKGLTANQRWVKYKNKTQAGEQKQVKNERYSPAKILIFDIETAPLRSYVWRLWKQNVNPTNGQLQSEWFLLTWSAKWLFDDKVMAERLTPEEAQNEDDTRLVTGLWKLFDEADIVVAHFGKGFDIPIMNGRFVKQNLPPPMPYQVIDTKQHASKQFLLPSNKLDYLGEYLGVGRKEETGGFELWAECMKGDAEALAKMEKYNIQDVKLLEAVYLKMLPFIKPHPNMGLYISENVNCCPSCGNTEIEWGGNYNTYANSFQAFRCKSCGSIGRSRNSNIDKESRRFLTLSVPA